jgi:hypothetical protein
VSADFKPGFIVAPNMSYRSQAELDQKSGSVTAVGAKITYQNKNGSVSSDPADLVIIKAH